MPYSSVKELPDRIKKLSAKKQRQWMAAWNSTFSKTKDEGRAFAAANSVIKESREDEPMSKKNGMRDFEFISDLEESVGIATVDKEAGIIQGVVILTGEKVSRNKTFYTRKAINEAVERYNGAKMYLDHPKKEDGNVRSVRDLGGTFKNLRIEENKYLKADLHLLPSPNLRNLIIPIAEAKPTGVGLSIRDRGKGRDENGTFLVEGFAPKNKTSFSIDLVTETSVNETLFESTQQEDDMKIEEITLEDLQNGNPALVEQIRTDERQKVAKELEEKYKGDTDKVILEAKKTKLLAEAKFDEKVMEQVKKLIEPETVTIEMAESIVNAQKEIIGTLKPAGDPKVKGHGGSQDQDVHEGELPSDDELLESVKNA